MLLLTSASDLIKIVSASGGAAVKCHASWVDNVSGAITPGRTNTASITTAATTTIVAGPASGQRSVRHLNIRNDHASASETITVSHDDGTTVEPLFKVTLAAGESVVYGENGIWVYYDPNGKPYMGLGPLATQADMEAGSSAVVVVTPSVMQYHPGVAKCWLECGVAADITASYNITSLTDTGTGVVTITIATDFSSANWCCLAQVEATGTTWAVANTRECHVRNATIAAGSVALDCVDNTATTSVVKDPTHWFMAGFGDQ